MSRLASVILLALVLLGAAIYAASPILSFHHLRQAARAGDRDTLEALVDFPAVREGLKPQVDSRAVKLARKAQGLGLPGAVVGKLGSGLGDRAVNRLITPEGVSAMVQTGELIRRRKHKHDDQGGEGPSTPGVKPGAVHYAYLSPDRFRARVGSPGREIGFIMDRKGLFSWRVVAIELPESRD